MISMTCAIMHNEFHSPNHAKWQRNGRTKLWKTKPNNFCIPVKHGLYRYGTITEVNNTSINPSDRMHCACTCVNAEGLTLEEWTQAADVYNPTAWAAGEDPTEYRA